MNTCAGRLQVLPMKKTEHVRNCEELIDKELSLLVMYQGKIPSPKLYYEVLQCGELLLEGFR